MAWSTAARRSALTFGEPCSTRETRDLETPARSATSRMVGREADGSPGDGNGTSAGGQLERSTSDERSLPAAWGGREAANDDAPRPWAGVGVPPATYFGLLQNHGVSWCGF